MNWAISNSYNLTKNIFRPVENNSEFLQSLLNPITIEILLLRSKLQMLLRDFGNIIAINKLALIPTGIYAAQIFSSRLKNENKVKYFSNERFKNLTLSKPWRGDLSPGQELRKIDRPLLKQLNTKHDQKLRSKPKQAQEYLSKFETQIFLPSFLIEDFRNKYKKNQVKVQNEIDKKVETSSKHPKLKFFNNTEPVGSIVIPINSSINLLETNSVRLSKPLLSIHEKVSGTNSKIRIKDFPNSSGRHKFVLKSNFNRNLRSVRRGHSKVKSLKINSGSSLLLPVSMVSLIEMNKQMSRNEGGIQLGFNKPEIEYNQPKFEPGSRSKAILKNRSQKGRSYDKKIGSNLKLTKISTTAIKTVNIPAAMSLLNSVTINKSVKQIKYVKNRLDGVQKDYKQNGTLTSWGSDQAKIVPREMILNKPTSEDNSNLKYDKSQPSGSILGLNWFPGSNASRSTGQQSFDFQVENSNLLYMYPDLKKVITSRVTDYHSAIANLDLMALQSHIQYSNLLIEKNSFFAPQIPLIGSKLKRRYKRDSIYIGAVKRNKIRSIDNIEAFNDEDLLNRNFIPIIDFDNQAINYFPKLNSSRLDYDQDISSSFLLPMFETRIEYFNYIDKKGIINKNIKSSKRKNKKFLYNIPSVPNYNVKDHWLFPEFRLNRPNIPFSFINTINANSFPISAKTSLHKRFINPNFRDYNFKINEKKISNTNVSNGFSINRVKKDLNELEKNEKSGSVSFQAQIGDCSNEIRLSNKKNLQFQDELRGIKNSLQEIKLRILEEEHSDKNQDSIKTRIFDHKNKLANRFKKLIFEAWQEGFRQEVIQYGYQR